MYTRQLVCTCGSLRRKAVGTVDGWAQVYERPSVKHSEKPKSGCTPSAHLFTWLYMRVSVKRLRCSHSCTRRDFCVLQAHSVACSNNWVCNRLQLSEAVVHPMSPLGKCARSPSASAASPEVNKKTRLEYILPELHQIPNTSTLL